MKKRLVRKTFDMIQELSESEDKEVGNGFVMHPFYVYLFSHTSYFLRAF